MKLFLELQFASLTIYAVLSLLLLASCLLDRTGRGRPCLAVIDEDFRGCFERAETPVGEIHLVQDDCSNLSGIGFGLTGSEGFRFVGQVTSPGNASLIISSDEAGVTERRAIDAQLVDPDILVLRTPFEIRLTRCL